MKVASNCVGGSPPGWICTHSEPRGASSRPAARPTPFRSGTYCRQKALFGFCSGILREVISDVFSTIGQLTWGQRGFLNRTWQGQWKQSFLASWACEGASAPQDSSRLDWGMHFRSECPHRTSWVPGSLQSRQFEDKIQGIARSAALGLSESSPPSVV